MIKKFALIFFIQIFIIQVFGDLEYPPYGCEEWNKNTTGNHKVLVVIVNFNDFKNLTTIEEIQEKLNLLKEFYYNNSYKKLNLSFDIKFVNLSKDMRYYGEDGGFGNTSWKRIDELGYKYHHYGEDFSYQDSFPNDVLEILDNEVNFLDYDHIIFIHSYYDEASKRDCLDCLWSIYMPYINFTSNDLYYYYLDGNEWKIYKGNIANENIAYCDNSTYWNNTWWCKTNTSVNFGIIVSEDDSFGVIAHEFGHELGLPDLYNIETGNSVVGNYDLMDSGSWNNENFGAFSKYKLKFSNPVEVNETNETLNFTLNLSNFYDSFVKINVDNWTYFLIEYRKIQGKNAFLIWEVKEDKANNTEINDLMVNVYNFSENSTFKKYNTEINFSIFENFSIVNISNKFFKRNISRVLNVDFCTTDKNLNVLWLGKNFSWCDEKDTRNSGIFLNNESFYAIIKLNLDKGDNVNVVFKDSNLTIIKNYTYKNLKLQRGNAYNTWNNYIDNIIATLNISNLTGKYIMEIYVNEIKIYEKNLTILNYIENSVVINFSIQSHYYNKGEIKIENYGGNLSEIWIDYWNKKFCNLKECHKKYVIDEEKLNLLNNKKNINLTFYGNPGNEYCFQIYGTNFYKTNNTEILCTKFCKNDLNLGIEILEHLTLNEMNDICYDFNFDNNVDVFDVSELLENLNKQNL